VDGAQRHEEAPRSLRLLPDDAVPEGDALVQIARLEAPRAETGEHGVTVAQPLVPIGRRPDGQVEPARPRHLVRDCLHNAQALLVQIDQHDLGAVELLALPDERRHSAGSARAASANVRQLDTCHGGTAPLYWCTTGAFLAAGCAAASLAELPSP
jgi:hypothetical protein